LRERQEFAFEAAERLRNRFFMIEVWERMGVEAAPLIKLMLDNPPPERNEFQHMLFSKIVPNCKKLGLLDAGDGWLRTKFEELGIIQYENWTDTSDEYEQFALENLPAAATA
ncbi:MAG: ferritin-like domain-containing protein, partial [Microthrixaceae bacterium]|nr:ferritin-like domain-containing protein [Microthrixaceae bacterium]